MSTVRIEASVGACGVHMLEQARFVDADGLRLLADDLGMERLFVCDAYVGGIESSYEAEEIRGGFYIASKDLVNIDHHAPDPRMMGTISSTPLAIEYIDYYGRTDWRDHFFINHIDADSVLSVAVMAGMLEPEERFAEAAVAADHTGESNAIADLLQACGKVRNFAFAWFNLKLLLEGKRLDDRALDLLEKRQRQRQAAEQMVRDGQVEVRPSGMAVIETAERIDGVFWPALLPEVKVFVQFTQPQDGSNMTVGWRLGGGAPEGAHLLNLDIQSFDPHYGGRWNAGNNSRTGGTSLTKEQYVHLAEQLVRQAMP